MGIANQLDLHQLRAFHALGQCGGFSAAARRLNLTQSAVSHAVAKLETAAGVALVQHAGRQLRLTDAGRRLWLACEQVFATLEAAAEDLGESRSLGQLRLGATTEFGSSVLMRHIGPFLADHPGIELDFTLGYDLLPSLLRDDLDLAIDCRQHLLPELDRLPLFRETYVVAGSREFRTARAITSPRDLGSCPVLSMDKAGAWWHRLLLALPEPERPVFARIIGLNDLRAMINAAAAGLGALLAPTYSVLRELQRGELVPLLPHIGPVEDWFCLYQKKSKASLRKHQLLTRFLQSISPGEFGL
jgi:DNA-binding transcriptional LysR family regulator